MQVEKYAHAVDQLTDEQIKILSFTDVSRSNNEIQESCLGLKRHNDNFKRYINPLLNMRLLARTVPRVPNSPIQKYFTTNKGYLFLLILDYKQQS